MSINCSLENVNNKAQEKIKEVLSKYQTEIVNEETWVNVEDSSAIISDIEDTLKDMFNNQQYMVNNWAKAEYRTDEKYALLASMPKAVEALLSAYLFDEENTKVLTAALNTSSVTLDPEKTDNVDKEKGRITDNPASQTASEVPIGSLRQAIMQLPNIELNAEKQSKVDDTLLEETEAAVKHLKSQVYLDPTNKKLQNELLILNDFHQNLLKTKASVSEGARPINFLLRVLDILETVEDLLPNESLKNTQLIDRYIKDLSSLFASDVSESSNYIFTEQIKAIEANAPELFGIIAGFQGKINSLRNLHNNNVDELFGDLIAYYLNIDKNLNPENLQGEEFDDFVKTETERVLADLRLDIDNVDVWLKEFSELLDKNESLDKHQEKLTLTRLLAGLYSYNFKRTEKNPFRQKLADLKTNLEKYFKETGTDYDIFYDKDNPSKLVSIFNGRYQKTRQAVQELKNRISYLQRKVRTSAEQGEFIMAKNKYNASFIKDYNHLDVRLIPEILENGYGEGGAEEHASAQQFKEAYIKKYGINVYKTLVREALKNLSEYKVFSEHYLETAARFHGATTDTFKEKFPEEYAKALQTLNLANPLHIAEQLKTNPNFIQDNYEDISLIFSSGTLKDAAYKAYINTDFLKRMEDPIFARAYNTFIEILNYINSQNYSGKGGTPYDIPRATDMFKTAMGKNINFFQKLNKKALIWLQKVFTTQAYVGLKERSINPILQSYRTIDTSIRNETDKIMKLLKATYSGVNWKTGLVTADKFPLKKLATITGLPLEVVQEIAEKFKTDPRSIGEVIVDPNYSYKIKELVTRVVTRLQYNTQNKDLIENLENSLSLAERIEATVYAKEEAEFILNKLRRISVLNGETSNSNREELKNLVALCEDFILKKIYGVNNRANWMRAAQGPDKLGTVRIRAPHQKALMKEVKNAVKELEKRIEEGEIAVEELNIIEKELEALKKYLDSGGTVVTTGSILEAFTITAAYFRVFWSNCKAALANIAYGSVNAYELDGIYWDEGGYFKARARLATVKKLPNKLLRTKRGEQYYIANLLYNRLGVYQASTEHIHKIGKGINVETAKDMLKNPVKLAGLNSEAEKVIQNPQILAILASHHKDGTLRYPIKNKDGKEFPVVDLDGKDLFPAFQFIDGKLSLKEEFDTKENRQTWIENRSPEWVSITYSQGRLGQTIAAINGRYDDAAMYHAENSSLTFWALMFKRFLFNHINKRTRAYKASMKKGRLSESFSLDLMSNLIYTINSPISLASTYLGIPGGIISLVGSAATLPALFCLKQEMIDHIKTTSKGRVFAFIGESAWSLARDSAKALGLISLKATQLLTNSVAKNFMDNNYLIKNKHINAIMGMKNDDATLAAHFLAVGGAKRMLWTLLRMMLLTLMRPDKDEEDAYKDLLSGQDAFIERFLKMPKVMAFYVLDNYFQRLIRDINALSNVETAGEMGEIMILDNFKELYKSFQEPGARFQKGVKVGRNKAIYQLDNLFAIPYAVEGPYRQTLFGVVPYDLNFGFASMSQRRTTTKDPISKIFDTTEKKIASANSEFNDFLKEELGISAEELTNFKNGTGTAFNKSEKVNPTFNKDGEFNHEGSRKLYNNVVSRRKALVERIKGMSAKEKEEYAKRLSVKPAKKKSKGGSKNNSHI